MWNHSQTSFLEGSGGRFITKPLSACLSNEKSHYSKSVEKQGTAMAHNKEWLFQAIVLGNEQLNAQNTQPGLGPSSAQSKKCKTMLFDAHVPI